jgi:uncharacterized phage protein (TIGR02220 family)
MEYKPQFNQAKAIEWGLSLQEAILMEWYFRLPTWANQVMDGSGETWYFGSRNKVIDDLPLLTDKPDTVYRWTKVLVKKGLIEIAKFNNQDYIKITDKGRLWKWLPGETSSEQSDSHPSEVGQPSEEGSDSHPTNYNTKNTLITKDHIEDLINEVIDYLNTKAEKSFRKETEAHRKHIRGRIDEGRELTDFKKVIDIKVKQWKGGKMDKYLRPQTLFIPGHFDAYLNEKEFREGKSDDIRSGIGINEYWDNYFEKEEHGKDL